MSSVPITRRLQRPDPTGERPIARSVRRAALPAASVLAPSLRKPKGMAQANAPRFVIALVPRGTPAREKRYLARRNGRTHFVSQAREARTYATYRTAHMIGIKAAVHYGCVACIEEV